MKKLLFSIITFLAIITSLCEAQNPVLWGMTSEGGVNGGGFGDGVIFSYNSSTNIVTDAHNFGSGTDGYTPYGPLFQASNGLLYGMTYEGGTKGYGTIFSYNISKGTETDLHDFNDTDGNAPNLGSLVQVNDSLLYGMTLSGGIKDSGTIFSYNIPTGIETVVYSFEGGSTDGYYPSGSLIQVNDSILYGMTQYGGAYSSAFNSGGIIFSYNISTGKETDIHDFGSDTDGKGPYGSFIQVSDSLLYGMTTGGGNNLLNGGGGDGMIFNYNISTGKETSLHDFNDTDGLAPFGSLIQASNGLLYGMTTDGGTNGKGTIFSYNISKSMEIVLHDFGSGKDGQYPFGSLMQASDSLLYGMTLDGGTNGYGMIFSYNITTGAEIDIHDFNENDGKNPYGNLLEVDSPATGINQLSANNNLSIYPNPTSGQFTIKLNGNQNGYTVEIYNVVGERIYQSVLSNSQNIVNLGAQPDGLYFVYLKSEEGVLVQKVLVTK